MLDQHGVADGCDAEAMVQHVSAFPGTRGYISYAKHYTTPKQPVLVCRRPCLSGYHAKGAEERSGGLAWTLPSRWAFVSDKVCRCEGG